MRRRPRLLIGAAIAVAGLALGLFPLVSVWRVSGQVLDELPSLANLDSTDRQHRISALVDPEFILARRVYESATIDEVRQALVDGGYQSFSLRGEVWFGKECCGDYDGVWVSVVEADDRPRAVTLLVTTADDDIRSAAGLFGFLGLLLLVPGIAIGASGARRDDRRGQRKVKGVPETIG